jgi:sugar lactone lactonase YvrE
MKFTPGGVGSLFASNGLAGPIDLAFDNTGNLYVANNANNTIEKFTSGGTGSFFASTGANSAYGLAVDGANNLYAAIYSGHEILKFTPDGASSVFADTGAYGPDFIAIIPEPPAWAMLGLGIPALLTLRRGKARPNP